MKVPVNAPVNAAVPWLLALLALGAGCVPLESAGRPFGCQDDAACGTQLVCFADGCGDPGENIVVEIKPNPKAGLHAQDFRVEALRPQHHLELQGPALLQGQVLRESSATQPSSPAAYTSPITLRAIGQSLLIPGMQRWHEGSLTPTESGYQLPVGSGQFTIFLLTSDPEVPPLADTRTVLPGNTVPLDFLLPAPDALKRLSGRLVRYGQTLVDAELQVQALDEQSRPLSQRVLVQRSTGEFSLMLAPQVVTRASLYLEVTANSPDSLVPRKTFTVDPRQPLPTPLELGDYGEPVTVQGRVVDARGTPLAGASVYLQGRVSGGGTFRTPRSVFTDSNGQFSLRSLPSGRDTPMSLYALPPPGARAGLARLAVVVPRTNTVLPNVVCPDRLAVQGTLLQPDGFAPASDVRVLAEPIQEVQGWPYPETNQEPVRTDASGRFQLLLDPGRYRLDFLPNSPSQPRVSRFVTVLPADLLVSPTPLELPSFVLSRGSLVSGTVTQQPGGQLLPYASIRFFRVGHVEGQPIAILLAETFTDSYGRYSVTLPTR